MHSLAACGSNHSACVCDGGVWVFGSNERFQLGMEGRSEEFYFPVRNPHLRNIIFVACGFDHTACIDAVGNLWMFGENSSGQLGRGNMLQYRIPVKALNLESQVRSVGCGRFHTICCDFDGHVFSFGKNSKGQLGLTKNTSSSPERVHVEAYIISVSAGAEFSLLLDDEGTSWFTGDTLHGQSGKEISHRASFQFEKIPDLLDIVAISTGYAHSLFLDNEGVVFSCGWGEYGQLGREVEGESFNRDSCTAKPILHLPPIRLICAGVYHSLFVDLNGRLWSCGDDRDKQLCWEQCEYELVNMVETMENVQAISQGGCHSIAKTSEGAVYVWGNNYKGQLGLGRPSFGRRVTRLTNCDHILGLPAISRAKSALK